MNSHNFRIDLVLKNLLKESKLLSGREFKADKSPRGVYVTAIEIE